MKSVTYLLYIVFWESLTLGGSVYLVVAHGWSLWTVLLGLFMSGSAYSPRKWIHGVEQTDTK